MGKKRKKRETPLISSMTSFTLLLLAFIFCCCSLLSCTILYFFAAGRRLLLLVDCWYITPPIIQIKSPTVPTNLECLSHTTRLITTVNSLFTVPRTVNPVAEITLLQESPKKEMDRPNKHDKPTGKTTSKEYQFHSWTSCLSFSHSSITSNSNGNSRRASRLL